LTAAALYLSAIGANLAWIISLCSHLTFSSKRGSGLPRSGTHATKPLTV